jgi:hypothetical protein
MPTKTYLLPDHLFTEEVIPQLLHGCRALHFAENPLLYFCPPGEKLLLMVND